MGLQILFECKSNVLSANCRNVKQLKINFKPNSKAERIKVILICYLVTLEPVF